MTTKNFFTAILCTAALLTSGCSENEEPQVNPDRTPLAVDAGIATLTKASDAAWAAGDKIGVFMTAAGTTEVSDNVANLPYIASGKGASTSFAPATADGTAYFPVGKAAVDVRAYYPHATATTDAGLVAIDLSTQANLAAIDLMVAASETAHTSETPAVPLTFTHRLSKLVVKLKADASAVDVALPGAELMLSGTAAKATYSLFDDKLTSGAAADLKLAINAEGTDATAIVLPTAAGSGVSFSIKTASGKFFKALLPADFALEAGTMATVTITLRQTEAAVEATITDWTEGPETEVATLLVDIPAGPSGEPIVKNFVLTKNNDTTGAVTYAWNNGTWTTNKAAFKVEDILDTDRFTAIHTPETGNPEPDVLAAGPVGMKEGRIALDFAHIQTLVTVDLITTADYLDLDDAKISIEGLYGTDAFVVEEEKPYIFLPRELKASDRIVVELDGATYVIALTDILIGEEKLTELESGKAYEFGLRFEKSLLSATVDVLDWDESYGKGTARLDIASGIVAEGLPGDGTLAIAVQGKTATYTYTAATATFSAITPLYWEELAKEESLFTATFTPAATANPEKDIITGSITADWGTNLVFDELAHINAKLKVTLKAGDGFSSTSGMTMTVSGLTDATAPYALTSGTAHIFLPQELDEENVLTVTAGGFDYSIALTEIELEDETLTELEAGTAYDIELTVSKTGLGLTLEVNDWNVKTGSGSIKY